MYQLHHSNYINHFFSGNYLVVREPPCILLPVNLLSLKSSNLHTLDQVATALSCPKLFTDTTKLGISVLIDITGSLTMSATALIQQIYSTYHVNNLSKTVSLPPFTQEQID